MLAPLTDVGECAAVRYRSVSKFDGGRWPA